MTSAYDDAAGPSPSTPDSSAPSGAASAPQTDAGATPAPPTVLQRAKALWCQLVSGLG